MTQGQKFTVEIVMLQAVTSIEAVLKDALNRANIDFASVRHVENREGGEQEDHRQTSLHPALAAEYGTHPTDATGKVVPPERQLDPNTVLAEGHMAPITGLEQPPEAPPVQNPDPTDGPSASNWRPSGENPQDSPNGRAARGIGADPTGKAVAPGAEENPDIGHDPVTGAAEGPKEMEQMPEVVEQRQLQPGSAPQNLNREAAHQGIAKPAFKEYEADAEVARQEDKPQGDAQQAAMAIAASDNNQPEAAVPPAEPNAEDTAEAKEEEQKASRTPAKTDDSKERQTSGANKKASTKKR